MLSPPIDLQAKWFESHAAYTVSKYSMSLMAMGLAAEFRRKGHCGQCALAAHHHCHLGAQYCREHIGVAWTKNPTSWLMPRTSSSRATAGETTGQFFIDESVLREAGMRSDFSPYLVTGNRTHAGICTSAPDVHCPPDWGRAM